jgi:hypothetical protein
MAMSRCLILGQFSFIDLILPLSNHLGTTGDTWLRLCGKKRPRRALLEFLLHKWGAGIHNFPLALPIHLLRPFEPPTTTAQHLLDMIWEKCCPTMDYGHDNGSIWKKRNSRDGTMQNATFPRRARSNDIYIGAIESSTLILR